MDTNAIAKRWIDGRSTIGDPTLSPDGTMTAFVVATTNLATNKTTSQVWIDDRPVTAGDNDANPAWSPDGHHLAFTSRRGDEKSASTLHVLPVSVPGELRTLCTMPDGLGSVRWSPDGTMLAFVSRTRHERYEAEDVSWQAPRKIERFQARLNGEDWIFDRPSHLHVVGADGTLPVRNLTPGEFAFDEVAWTPDSATIITSGSCHDGWDRVFSNDLFALDVAAALQAAADGDTGAATAAREQVTGTDGHYSAPAVSPDGTRLAFLGHADLTTYPQNAKVAVLPITARNAQASEILWASAKLDRTFGPTAGTQAPVWTTDETLLATAEDRGMTLLYRVAADGSKAPDPVVAGELSVTGFDGSGQAIVTARSTVQVASELFIGEERQTDISSRFSSGALAWEHFLAPATDGSAEIDGWIMRPANFDENKTYPVLLNVHGGPFSQYGYYFFDEAQMQAAAGFVVIMGNPRGSSGRETGWGQAILGRHHPQHPGSGWGSVDVEDVLATLDAALDRYGFCDRNRVGMLGGSYGGYMATWLAVNHGERFRGICSERAVNNLLSEEWSSDVAGLFKAQHGLDHLEGEEEYRRMSPIAGVRNITTPMLIIHSEDDLRCPIAQAEELWIALRHLEKEVDFYRFPGETHELSRNGSPVHRVQRAEIILDWFAEKLR